MKKPTLGVVMIVKNEEQNLVGILSDVRGVADEICIVDTGSSDGTIGVAESFGAKLGHFPWIDDFSAARNHSLALAGSDYLLWLDADDRIDEQARRALADLKPRLDPRKNRAYMLKILGRSQDMPDTVSYQTRIIPNRDGVRFEGRVHEQILPALQKCAIRVEPIDITIRHIGYHNATARTEKARRNLDILMQEFHAGKDTATQCFFIAMAYIGLEEYEPCLAYLAQARRKRTDEDWHHFSFTIATECLLKLKRVDDAHQEILRGIALFPESPLLHYYHGLVCMQAELFGEAAMAFGKAVALPPGIDTYPTPPDLDSIILIAYGKAMEKSGRTKEAIETYTLALKAGTRQKDLYFALGMALLQLGRVTEALPHLEQARGLTPEIDPVIWLALAKVHLFLGHPGDAHGLYRESFANIPDDREAATGLIQTSVAMDDVEGLLAALEALMNGLGMDTDRDLPTSADIALLCAEVGKNFHDYEKSPHAARLGEAALAIDPACVEAHLLLADIHLVSGRRTDAITHLEQATHAGAPLAMIEERLKRMP